MFISPIHFRRTVEMLRGAIRIRQASGRGEVPESPKADEEPKIRAEAGN